MFNKKVEEAINQQIEKEAYSSQLYLAMASWAHNHGYSGSSTFLYLQAEEERMHMLKLFKYINDRGGHAIVPKVDQPPTEFESIKKIYHQVLEHERYITASINNLVGICIDERDFTTNMFLQWYVQEQIEEEANAQGIIDRLHLMGNDASLMYMFDKDMGAFHPAAGNAKAAPAEA